MTYTREDIIDALTVIKVTCEDFDHDEEGCPFWIGERCCITSTPSDWVLNETNRNWKAFR